MQKEQDAPPSSDPPDTEALDPTAQDTGDALETAHGVVVDPAVDRELQHRVESQIGSVASADLVEPPVEEGSDALLAPPDTDEPEKDESEQGEPEQGEPEQGEPEQGEPEKKRGIRGIASWFENRAHSAISKVYQTQADDLEERAKRVVGSAYKEHSDDLEERAIRALRRAISDEADRIKEAISHGVAVKKVEVRLSLFVLVVASLIYLGLYWFTQGGGVADK